MWRKLGGGFRIGFCWLAVGFFAGGLGFCTIAAQAAPLEQWYWRNPLPQGNTLNKVAFLNGTWLAVGELGTILTSADGTNWLSRETGLTDELRGCAYGAGTYVVVGDYGTVLTSPDGVSWTSQYAGTFYSLHAVTYATGQFVAVGEQSTILTSPDGIHWTPRSSGEWELYDITYADGSYAAVGGQQATANLVGYGVILTSPDAQVWTRRLLTTEGPFFAIAHGNGRFAAVTSLNYIGYSIWSSDDTVNWQVTNAPVSYGSPELFYGAGKWILADGYQSGSYTGTGELLVSTNLLNWTEVVTNTIPIRSFAGNNALLIAARLDGTFLYSSNGDDWKTLSSDALPLLFRDLKYINGSFVGVTDNALVFSSDGTTWTNRVATTNAGNLLSLTYGSGRYVAGGDFRTVWTSIDGQTWTNPAPDLTSAPYLSDVSVAYGNGVFVGAAGPEGDILTSPDGLNWTLQQLETNANASIYFQDVRFGNGRFVAVGDYAIATSVDGTSWALIPSSRPLTSIACGNGMFVAVGFNTIADSNDGTNWTFHTSSQFEDLVGVAYGAGFFVAAGAGTQNTSLSEESPLWVSSDGVHWSRRHSNTPRLLYRIAYGDGSFVVNCAGILQSDPLVTLTLTAPPSPQLLLSGPVHESYRIEYTDHLGTPGQWSELKTVTLDENPQAFDDPGWTTNATRFYRAVLLP